MDNVTFSHPLISVDLTIDINPDQITWAYGLNTQSFPTYGGEVIQILSVYFDDMTIQGTVASYAELEAIYHWFILYMQYATQGVSDPSYNQHPVKFTYNTRGWQFMIWPKALPSFRYGRDVIAPQWTVIASVKEPDATFAQQVSTLAQHNAASGQFATFGSTTADFGNTANLTANPFASPDGSVPKGESVSSWVSQQEQSLGDTYSGFVKSYYDNDLSGLPEFQDASKASSSTSKKSGSSTKSKTGKKVKKK